MAMENQSCKVLPYLLEYLQKRQEKCAFEYGTPLKTFNKRDANQDRYEELLDSTIFAKSLVNLGIERESLIDLVIIDLLKRRKLAQSRYGSELFSDTLSPLQIREMLIGDLADSLMYSMQELLEFQIMN